MRKFLCKSDTVVMKHLNLSSMAKTDTNSSYSIFWSSVTHPDSFCHILAGANTERCVQFLKAEYINAQKKKETTFRNMTLRCYSRNSR